MLDLFCDIYGYFTTYRPEKESEILLITYVQEVVTYYIKWANTSWTDGRSGVIDKSRNKRNYK